MLERLLLSKYRTLWASVSCFQSTSTSSISRSQWLEKALYNVFVFRRRKNKSLLLNKTYLRAHEFGGCFKTAWQVNMATHLKKKHNFEIVQLGITKQRKYWVLRQARVMIAKEGWGKIGTSVVRLRHPSEGHRSRIWAVECFYSNVLIL